MTRKLSSFGGRMIRAGLMLVVLATMAQATVVRISKSYPKGFSQQPDGSFRASSPIYIDDALAQGGYANNLNAQGLNEIIFQDSGVYSIVDDLAADSAQPAWQPGPICLGFGGNGGGFYETGAGGILVHAASGQRPIIDYSNMQPDAWGGHVVFHVYQHRPGQKLIFRNLHFRSSTSYNGAGMGYTEAVVRVGASGGPAPIFEECYFDTYHQILACLGWGDTGTVTTNAEVEFRRCVVWMRDNANQQRRNLVLFQTGQPVGGTFEFEECTFIGLGGATWSLFWGGSNEPAMQLTRCILKNMQFCGRYAAPAAYNSNCDWPEVGGKAAGSGNITADPLIAYPTVSATLWPSSPCVKPTLPNIGYDQATRPNSAEPTPTPTISPTPTPSPTPSPTPYVLKGPLVRVEKLMGVPTFKLDQDWLTIPGFSVYWPTTDFLADFRDVGTVLFDFPATGSRSDYTRVLPVWTDTNPDQWDHSQIHQFFDAVIGTNPNARIMPRVDIGTPDWWLQDPVNAGELEVLDTGSTLYTETGILPRSGPFPSLASTKWREDMAKGLRHYLSYAEQYYGDHIAGYKIMGLATDEWYHWSSGLNTLAGFSAPTTNAFRQWLREHYNNNVQSLRTAWNNGTVTFDNAAVPTKARRQAGQSTRTFRDLTQYRDVIDFYRFYNELIPDTIDYFAQVIKEHTQDTKAVGAFYGYFYEFNGNPEFGHNALGRYLASPNLDFVYVTASYGYRGLGTGGDYLRSQALSVQLHDKLFYNDNDVASVKTKEIFEDRFGWDATTVNHELTRLGYTPTVQQNGWMYRRAAGFITCFGIFQDYFDLHNGYYDDPAIMNEVGQLTEFYDQSRLHDRSSNSEILIVSDEASAAYTIFNSALNSHSLYEPQINLIKIGAQADHVLLDDLDLVNRDQYKLVVFLNCFNMTDAQRAKVNLFKSDNRTLLWCYAPGYFNGSTVSEANMQGASGLQFTVPGGETRTAPRINLNQIQHPLSNAIRNAGLTAFGPTQSICKRIILADPGGTALGTWGSSSDTAFGIREYANWKSIYVATANLPATVYREIARYAGVHIYNPRSDTFYANKSYLCIHPDGAGARQLSFPQAVNLYDAVTGTQLAEKVTNYTTRALQNGETLLLRQEPYYTDARNWQLYADGATTPSGSGAGHAARHGEQR